MWDTVIGNLIVAVGAVSASSGLWAFLQKRASKNTAQNRLLMGLAYDKIVTVGMIYIGRGYVTKDEYEEYLKFLVEPYREMGGNGVAERVAQEVGSLPFRALTITEVVVRENGSNTNAV